MIFDRGRENEVFKSAFNTDGLENFGETFKDDAKKSWREISAEDARKLQNRKWSCLNGRENINLESLFKMQSFTNLASVKRKKTVFIIWTVLLLQSQNHNYENWWILQNLSFHEKVSYSLYIIKIWLIMWKIILYLFTSSLSVWEGEVLFFSKVCFHSFLSFQ